ncbi:hypothetical protein HNQ80_004989 [Anaerosolibacter carboniphilus]|uniref:Spore germination protein n=1 Tax=Anaerosolibacter carboniphilus TaxID=1417629 RepID=A0A841KYV6_9FIRM|nr:spore germination protein [Anaerosolibacter carboniphilus]MBB6218814.1 hypothetical protein [Anaerosolibacter carboniphilus]
MFRRRKLQKMLQQNKNRDDLPIGDIQFDTTPIYDGPLTSSLKKNVQIIKTAFGDSNDLHIRELTSRKDEKMAIAYFEGFVDETSIGNLLINSLVNTEISINTLFEKNQLLPSNSLTIETFKEIYRDLMNGFVLVLIDGYKNAYAFNFMKWEKRSIEDSQLEKNLRGPRDAFVEDLKTNCSLIRRRIKNVNLQIDGMTLGWRSSTQLCMIYVRDIVNLNIVIEAKRRLQAIDFDNIPDSTYIAHFIEDRPLSIFPQVLQTEKPDKVVSNLLEGKVVILSDNSPTALLLPTVYLDFFHLQDDFYDRYYITTLGRFIRYLGAFLATLATPLYIALTAVNLDMLPTKLAIPFSQIRYIIPFPLIVEVLLMELTLELLREAGLRIPHPIGPSISIVGGLVIGQTAITAGLISPFLTIVVALSAIGYFSIPYEDMVATYRAVKYFLIAGAALFGLFGIGAVLTLFIIHLCSITSFGIPYMAPFSEKGLLTYLKDMVRVPVFLSKKRHSYYRPQDQTKVKKNE